MDIGPQRQAVVNGVGAGATVRAKMRSFQRRGGVASGDGALALIGVQQRGAE
jgi:hypothetical protein